MEQQFTDRQVSIAKAFGELWEELTENEETDFTTDLSNLWEKICKAEGMPFVSADEIRNF